MTPTRHRGAARRWPGVLVLVWLVAQPASALTTAEHLAALTHPHYKRHTEVEEAKFPLLEFSSLLETSSTVAAANQLAAQHGHTAGIHNMALTTAFCQSGVHLELRRRIGKDIAEMESVEAQQRATAAAVSFFNDAFIQPFIDLLTQFILNPLKEAFRDVLPWYLTGPITSILATMSPKPVVASIDAMLGMYMPPLVSIGLTKKLVKGLTLVVTAGLVSTVERTRSGNSGATVAGDGGGAQKVIAKEVSRRLGVDITNHMMDSVPRATERALSHTLATSLSTSVQYYYYCTYCYWFGDYCKQCFYLPDYTWKEKEFWKKQREAHMESRQFAKEMQSDMVQAMARVDKPLSPINADPGTPKEYLQRQNNELAKMRREAKLSRAGKKWLDTYQATQQEAPSNGRKLVERQRAESEAVANNKQLSEPSDSTVETEAA